MGGGNTKMMQHHHAIVNGDTSKYGSNPKYWDQRYLNEEGHQFDWFQRYGHVSEQTEFRNVIREFIAPRAYILNLGAGNSRLAEGALITVIR